MCATSSLVLRENKVFNSCFLKNKIDGMREACDEHENSEYVLHLDKA